MGKIERFVVNRAAYADVPPRLTIVGRPRKVILILLRTP